MYHALITVLLPVVGVTPTGAVGMSATNLGDGAGNAVDHGVQLDFPVTKSADHGVRQRLEVVVTTALSKLMQRTLMKIGHSQQP